MSPPHYRQYDTMLDKPTLTTPPTGLLNHLMTSIAAKPSYNLSNTGVPESEDSLCVSEGDLTDTVLRLPCENASCPTILKIPIPTANIIWPILLSLAGVTGMVWALYYLYSGPRRQKKSSGTRTVFYLLLRKLMWTDLIGKIITTPVAVIVYANQEWVGGVAMCNCHGFTMMLIGMVQHSLVSAMAIERYLGIRHGYWYSKNITPYRTRLLLLIIWMFSILFCALPLLGFGQYARQYPGTWCFVNTHLCAQSPWKHRLYTNLYGSINILNLTIIVTCNVVVIRTLLRIRLSQSQRSIIRFCQTRGSRKQRELEIQMVVLLIVITFAFMISFMPLDISLFVNQIVPHRDHRRELLFIRLTSINQIMDPWSYIIMRKVFTSSAWGCVRLALLGRSWSRKVSPPPFWINSKKTQKTNDPLQEDDLCENPPFEAIQYKGQLLLSPVAYDAEGRCEIYSLCSTGSEDIPPASCPYVTCTQDYADGNYKGILATNYDAQSSQILNPQFLLPFPILSTGGNKSVRLPGKLTQALQPRRHSWSCAVESNMPKPMTAHNEETIQLEKLGKYLIKPFCLNKMGSDDDCESQFLKDNEWDQSKDNFDKDSPCKTYL